MCAKLEENLGPMGSAVPCQACAHRIPFLCTSFLMKRAKCICHKDFPCPEYCITGYKEDLPPCFTPPPTLSGAVLAKHDTTSLTFPRHYSLGRGWSLLSALPAANALGTPLAAAVLGG